MTPGEYERLRRLREEQRPPTKTPWEPEPLQLPIPEPPPGWRPPAPSKPEPEPSHIIVIEL